MLISRKIVIGSTFDYMRGQLHPGSFGGEASTLAAPLMVTVRVQLGACHINILARPLAFELSPFHATQGLPLIMKPEHAVKR